MKLTICRLVNRATWHKVVGLLEEAQWSVTLAAGRKTALDCLCRFNGRSVGAGAALLTILYYAV
jgi:hypothetical protein